MNSVSPVALQRSFNALCYRRILRLNPRLAGIMKTKAVQETVTMEDGINKFIGRMTHMHEVTLAGNKLLHTGKLEPIDMRVTVRSGGKKVQTPIRVSRVE